MKLTLKNAFFFEPSSGAKIKVVVAESKKAEKKRLTLERAYGFSNRKALNEAEESGNIGLTPEDELTMKKMAVYADKIIDSTVPLEEKTTRDSSQEEVSKMASGAKGFAYEKTVINALRQAKAAGNVTDGAGACAVCPDADMNIYGDIFNLEVKLNKQAQMGGGSLRYFGNNNISFSQEDMDQSTKEMLTMAVKKNSSKIDNLVEFLSKQHPKEINSKAKGFPGTWTKDAWVKANKSGLLFNIRDAAKVTVDHLAHHYAKKGVYYIQIGGAGLFYLSQNPANLPVPKLEGIMNIEMGTRPGGSKVLGNGIRVVGAGIRVQGRLKTTNSSPYTLDDPTSIQKLLAAIKDKRNKKQSGSKKSALKNKAASKEPEVVQADDDSGIRTGALPN